jgi:serine phosphatase RsbU (regulator of sigma subunit)
MSDAPGLFPDRLPTVPGVELAATHLPGAEACGDWYDAIALPDGTITLAIADVAGRGPPAGVLAARLRAGLREHAGAGAGPGEVVGHVNRLVDDVGTEMSTLMVLSFSPVTGELRGSNAGAPPALIRRTGGRVERWDAARSVPLGVGRPGPYPEDTVHLSPGDAVLMFTDGLIERRGASLDDALASVEQALPVFGSADGLRTTVLEAILGELDHDDDVAVLVLAVPAVG